MKFSLLLLCALFSIAFATTLFEDNFDKGDASKWVHSTHKGDEAAQLTVSGGKWASTKGLKTTKDAKFYQSSAKFASDFSNKGKTFVVQFSVAHEQQIDCGGGYVKILPSGLDQSDFHGESEYAFMFGPDICGATKKTHLIVTYKGKNHLIKNDIPCETDDAVHLYTLIVKPDNTFVVKIDNVEKKSGSFADEKLFDMLPPKEIEDESITKPADWVDEPQMDDPNSVKPEGWDDIPAMIADPEATKPEDWDEDLDGTWEPAQIDNPEYKGEWKPERIANPDYKGPWSPTMKANPDFYEDNELYAFDSLSYVGIDVWQVKSGTLFDDFLITDDVAAAEKAATKFLERKATEDKKREEIKEKERKEAEEAAAAASADEEAAGGDGEEPGHDEL